MRRLSIAFGALALAFTGTAYAANMPLKAPARVAAPTWTGFYLGGNVGGGWANTDFSGTATDLGVTSTFSGSTNLSGVLGGGQIGANYQLPNNWVVGVEADVDWANPSSTASVCTVAAGVTTGCASDTNKIDDFGTVRGRFGYAADNVLVYGTGGWAWARATTAATLNCAGTGCPATSLAFTGGATSASATPSGWTAGAGIEWAFTRNVTLGVEYLHLQFDGIGETFSSTGTLLGTPFTLTSSSTSNTRIDVARVNLNYLFR